MQIKEFLDRLLEIVKQISSYVVFFFFLNIFCF